MRGLGGPLPNVDAPRRPGRVRVAGVILYIEAGVAVLAAGGFVFPAALFGDTNRLSLLAVATLFLAFGLVSYVLGFFVLNGRQWARMTAIAWSVAWIIVDVFLPGMRVVVDAAQGESIVQFADDPAAGSGVLVNVAMLWLLGTEPARRYFGKPGSATHAAGSAGGGDRDTGAVSPGA